MQVVILRLVYLSGEFRQNGLRAHNEYRQVHGAPAMTLNAAMSASAQAYAQKLASQLSQGGHLKHAPQSERNGEGENLSMKCGPFSDKMATAREVTKDW